MGLDLFEGRGFNGATLTVASLALLVAVVAAYFAREAVFPPRRRLTIHLLAPAQLLKAAAPSGLDGLEVSRNGRVLEDPYVVTIVIRNTGRHAVGSEHFDRGRPIMISLAAPVAGLLGSPVGRAESAVSVDDQAILFGPDLIRRRQEIVIQALVTRAPSLGPEQVSEHLVDTTVKVDVDSYSEAPDLAKVAIGIIATLLALAGVVGIAGFVDHYIW